jgi:hypothetical protein
MRKNWGKLKAGLLTIGAKYTRRAFASSPREAGGNFAPKKNKTRSW